MDNFYADEDQTVYCRDTVPLYIKKIHERITKNLEVSNLERTVYNKYVERNGPLSSSSLSTSSLSTSTPLDDLDGPLPKERGLGDALGKVKNFIFGDTLPNKNFDMVAIFSKFYSNSLSSDEQKVFNAYIKRYGFQANSMPLQGTMFNPSSA
jgi:hypothetical protein